jgi:hypothetical protein
MAEPVPARSDVSAGTYECTNCGNRIDVDSTRHLPPCPSWQWRVAHPLWGETASRIRIRTARRVATERRRWVESLLAVQPEFS